MGAKMKIAFIFPGYGSQYVGMGKDVYDNQRVVQEYFEEAYNCLDLNFVKLCFASSDDEISEMENAYLSLFLVNVSLFALLKENGIEPDWVAGYGMGSYSALFSAGAFTFPDGLYLIKKLSSFYKTFSAKNELVALEIKGKIEGDIPKDFEIATFKSDDIVYLVGPKNKSEKIIEELKSQKLKVKKVEIGHCLNSKIFENVAKDFEIYLQKVDFKKLKYPHCSSSNRDITSESKIKSEIIEQILAPNKWSSVVNRLKKFDLVVEVGPGSVLTDLVKTKYPDLNVVTFNKNSDVDKLKQIIETTKSVGESGDLNSREIN